MPGLRAAARRDRRRVAPPARRARPAGRAAPPGDRREHRHRRRGTRRARRRPSSTTRSRTSHEQYDPRFGGFGRAPKFPQAMTITLLLDIAATDRRPDAPEVLEMATGSLDAMAAGGIYDQVGGGFHRYSVDAHWLVPHFEKMLYDQALLVRAYLHGWMVTGTERYRRVVEETITYVLRDLRTPTAASSRPRTPTPRASRASSTCGRSTSSRRSAATRSPTWCVTSASPHAATSRTRTPASAATSSTRSGRPEDRPESIAAVLPALFAAREHRVRPGLDDKVLLGWNALFLRSLVEAAHALQRDDWMDAARTNARFLLRELRRDDGRLLRSWQDGRANLLAYAEDYAALLEALLTLAELDDVQWLAEARAVADGLRRALRRRRARWLLHHRRRRRGAHRAAQGLPGQRDAVGELARGRWPAPPRRRSPATPTARERAERWLATLAPVLGEHPTAFAFLLEALERVVRPPLEVAIVGDDGAGPRRARRRRAHARAPGCGAGDRRAGRRRRPHPAPRRPRRSSTARPAAYVCERFACRLPVTDPEALRDRARRAGADAVARAASARRTTASTTTTSDDTASGDDCRASARRPPDRRRRSPPRPDRRGPPRSRRRRGGRRSSSWSSGPWSWSA